MILTRFSHSDFARRIFRRHTELVLAGLLKAAIKAQAAGSNRVQIKCLADHPILFLDIGMPCRHKPVANQIYPEFKPRSEYSGSSLSLSLSFLFINSIYIRKR